MKVKRRLYFIVGSIIIVVAIIAASIFLISTKDVEPATSSFNFDGTWRVFDGNATEVEEQYLVFTDGKVSFYSEKEEPSFTSEYEYSGGMLELPDAGTEFVVNIGSENCLFLYGSNSASYTIIRCAGDAFAVQDIDMSELFGTWDVIVRGKETRENEKLILEGDSLINERDDSTVEATFTIEGTSLFINELGSKLSVYRLEDDFAILVEIYPTIGNAYELVRSQDSQG